MPLISTDEVSRIQVIPIPASVAEDITQLLNKILVAYTAIYSLCMLQLRDKLELDANNDEEQQIINLIVPLFADVNFNTVLDDIYIELSEIQIAGSGLSEAQQLILFNYIITQYSPNGNSTIATLKQQILAELEAILKREATTTNFINQCSREAITKFFVDYKRMINTGMYFMVHKGPDRSSVRDINGSRDASLDSTATALGHIPATPPHAAPKDYYTARTRLLVSSARTATASDTGAVYEPGTEPPPRGCLPRWRARKNVG